MTVDEHRGFAELTHPDTGIRISYGGTDAAVAVPYWYSGATAQGVVETALGLWQLVETETGLVGHDPQTGLSLAEAKRHPTAMVAVFNQVAGLADGAAPDDRSRDPASMNDGGGAVSVDWNGYEPYVPPHDGPVYELPPKHARETFERAMAAKPARIEQLRRLLAANGLVLGGDDDSVQRLNDWFRTNVEANPGDPSRLENLWYAVVFDTGLFLGDVMIQRSPGLRWEMFKAGRRDVAYQKHVIVGFTKVANPKYNVDIDRVVATYGHQVINRDDVDPQLFVAVLRDAAAKA